MSNIQTLAVKITRKTWPIATACLPGAFSAYTFDKVKGCYLVLNDPQSRSFKKTGNSPIIVLGNAWMKKDFFDSRYKFVGKEKKNQFVVCERR